MKNKPTSDDIPNNQAAAWIADAHKENSDAIDYLTELYTEALSMSVNDKGCKHLALAICSLNMQNDEIVRALKISGYLLLLRH